MSEWLFFDEGEVIKTAGEFGGFYLCQQYLRQNALCTRWVMCDDEFDVRYALPAAVEPITLFAIENNLGDEFASLLVRAFVDGRQLGERIGRSTANDEMKRAVNLVFGPLASIIRGSA